MWQASLYLRAVTGAEEPCGAVRTVASCAAARAVPGLESLEAEEKQADLHHGKSTLWAKWRGWGWAVAVTGWKVADGEEGPNGVFPGTMAEQHLMARGCWSQGSDTQAGSLGAPR